MMTSIDFNDVLPAPPSGFHNVLWSSDNASHLAARIPNQVSAINNVTGSISLVAGSNIFFSVSPTGSTITINAVPATATQPGFSLNGITGSASLVEGANISILTAPGVSSLTISAASSATVVSAVGISGGNTLGVTGSSRGSVYLQGGNNITLSGNGSTITIIGVGPGATAPAFTLNSITGSASLVSGAGIGFSSSINTITISVSSLAPAVGISGGNSAGVTGSSTGTVYLQGGNNITLFGTGSTIVVSGQNVAPVTNFSLNGSSSSVSLHEGANISFIATVPNHITISAASSATVVSGVGIGSGGNTIGATGSSTGTVFFQAGNNITLSGTGNTVSIIGPVTQPASANVVSILGVTSGNTAGFTGTSTGSIYLQGGSNITLSVSNGTITIIGPNTQAPTSNMVSALGVSAGNTLGVIGSSTGSIYLQGGNNITLSAGASNITIIGAATHPAFSLNGITGSASIVGGGIAVTNPIGANTIQISVPASATVVSGVGISGGNSAGVTGSSTGTVYLQGGNNITLFGTGSTIVVSGPNTVPFTNFSLNNSSLSVSLHEGANVSFITTVPNHITISAASSATVVSGVGIGTGGNTAGLIGSSRGSIYFEGGNNITLSGVGSTISIIGPVSQSASGTVVSALGVSAGNTAGVIGSSRGSIYLQGGNNITLSAGASNITIIGPNVPAATNFSLNNITGAASLVAGVNIGLSAIGSNITISATNSAAVVSAFGVSAGNTLGFTGTSTGSIYLEGGNNITLSVSNSKVTIIGPTTQPVSGTVVSALGISDGNFLGATGSSRGSIYLVGGNNITLSGNASSITIIGQNPGATAPAFTLNTITGSASLVAGSNIYLSLSPTGSTITIHGPATSDFPPGFSLNDITGKASLVEGPNVSLIKVGSNITVSAASSATVVSAFGISGGNTSGVSGSSKGTIYLQGGNNITLSGNGSTITIIGASQGATAAGFTLNTITGSASIVGAGIAVTNPIGASTIQISVPASATVVSGVGIGSGGNTIGATGSSTGTVFFQAGNNITLSGTGNTVSIIGPVTQPASANVVSILGVTSGNTAGFTGTSTGSIYLQGGSNITLSVSNGTITIIGPNTQAPTSNMVSALGVSLGNTLGVTGSSTGSIYLQGGNNITLSAGASNITIIGAATHPAFSLNTITGSASLVSGAGIGFNQVGSSITISVSSVAPAVVTGVGIGTGGNTAGVTGSSTGTVYLQGGNNITLSGVGSTISIIGPTVPAATNFALNGITSSASIVGGGIAVTNPIGASTIQISVPASATVVSALGISDGNFLGVSGSSRGSIYLVGGNNITLSGNASSITIIGQNPGATAPAFTLNGITSSASLVAGPGIGINAPGGINSTITISVSSVAPAVVTGVGIGTGGNTAGVTGSSTGTVYLQGGNNITLSGVGSTISIIGPNVVAATNFALNNITSSASLISGPGIGFNQVGSSITISVSSVAPAVVTGVGISGGNSAGVTGSSTGTIYLQGSNNITLSGVGSTIRIIGPSPGGGGAIGVTGTAATLVTGSSNGTVWFEEGNNITLSGANSTITVIAADAVNRISIISGNILSPPNVDIHGAVAFEAHGNISLSYRPIGNAIIWSGPDPVEAFSINSSSGPDFLITAAGAVSIQNLSGNAIQISAPVSASVVSGVGISGTNTAGVSGSSRGSIYFVGGNNITLSGVGSTISIIGPVTQPVSGTVVSALGITGVNTAGVSGSSRGSLYLQGGNNITLSGIGSTIVISGPTIPAATNFSLNGISGAVQLVAGANISLPTIGSNITISASNSANVVSAFGVSAGNTLGFTGTSTGSIYLEGGNNITLSVSNSKVTIIGPTTQPVSGTVVSALGISDGNFLGVTGSSRGSIYLVGGNNITLSGAGSSITIIGQNPGLTIPPFTINTITGSASIVGGGIVVTNPIGSNTIQISAPASATVVSGLGISGGNSAGVTGSSVGSVYLQGGNNITLSGNGSTITIIGPNPGATAPAFTLNTITGIASLVAGAGIGFSSSISTITISVSSTAQAVVTGVGISGGNSAGVTGASTGSVYFQGGNNITLFGTGSTIVISGPNTAPVTNFSLNGSSSSVSLHEGANVSFITTVPNHITISAASSATVVSALGVSAGNFLGATGSSRGSVYLQGGNNITLSVNASTVTIIGPTIPAATNFTLNTITGSASIVGGGIAVTNPIGANTIQISVPASATVVSGVGIGTGGNTLGVTGASTGTVLFQGGNNITLSGVGSTISVIGANIPAATNFSLNGISSAASLVAGVNIGLSTIGSNITISASNSANVVSAFGVSAGNTLGFTGTSTGSIYLEGGNNITLSVSNSKITIIGPTTQPVSGTVVSALGISDGNFLGATGSSRGSIYLVGGNNITLSGNASSITIIGQNPGVTVAPFTLNTITGSASIVGAGIAVTNPIGANTIQISVPASATVVSGVGIGTGGNTAGIIGTSTGTVFFQGGNNITLSGVGSTISIIGPNVVAATNFALNGITGSASLVSGAGIGFNQVGSSITISVSSTAPAVVTGIGISGGNSAGVTGASTGSVYLQGGNNITLFGTGSTIVVSGPNTVPVTNFSLNGSSSSVSLHEGANVSFITTVPNHITISAASSATVVSGVGIFGGNTAGISGSSTGTVYLQGGNNITLSGIGSTIIISGPVSQSASGTVVSALGVSAGNTAGITGSSRGSIYLQGGNNITLSVNASTVTIIGPTIPAATNFTLNTITGSASIVGGGIAVTNPIGANTIQISVPASATVVSGVGIGSGGNTSGATGTSTGTVFFQAGNNITLSGIGNTLSIIGPATQPASANVVSAFGVTAGNTAGFTGTSTGSIYLQGGNNITLSVSAGTITINGPNTLPVSATVVSALGISDGNFLGVTGSSRGSIYLVGGNNITLSGAGSSITIIGQNPGVTVPAFSINNITGSASLVSGPGIGFNQVGSSITISVSSVAPAVVTGVGIGTGGNTAGVTGSSTGTILFQAGNNITLSGVGSTISIVGAATHPAFSLNNITGSASLASGAGIGFNQVGSSITISVSSVAPAVVTGVGIIGGNSAGVTGSSTGSVFLQGGNNITLSGVGSTIRIIGPTVAGAGAIGVIGTAATTSSNGTIWLAEGSNIILSAGASTITIHTPNVASAIAVSSNPYLGDAPRTMTGTINLRGGNGITLSVQSINNEIAILGPTPPAAFSINSSSGPDFLITAAGAVSIQNLSGNAIQISAPLSASVVSGVGITGVNTAGVSGSSRGSVYFQGGNNITLSGIGSTIVISGAATQPASAVVVSALGVSAGNILGLTGSSRGSIFLEGGNNITLSAGASNITIVGPNVPAATNFALNGITSSASIVGAGIAVTNLLGVSTIQISVPASASVVSGVGIGTGGNTAGIIGSSRGTVFFQGGNNITLSGVGSTISIVGPTIPAATNFSLNGISAAVSLVAGANISLSTIGSNITISVSNTASVVSAFGVTGGNILGFPGTSTGTVYIQGGNNITLSVSNGTVSIIGNFSQPASATVVSGLGISGGNFAGGTGSSTGTLYLQGGNNITLSGNGSTITIVGPAVPAATNFALNGITSSASLISGAGIGFNQVGSSITISVSSTEAQQKITYTQNFPIQQAGVVSVGVLTATGATAASAPTNPFGSSLSLQRIYLPGSMALTEVDLAFGIGFPATSQGQGSMSQTVVIYSFGNSTSLASVMSASRAVAWASGTTTSGTASSLQQGWDGNNIQPFTFTSRSLAAGEYAVGHLISWAAQSTNWTVSVWGANAGSSLTASAVTNIASTTLSGASSLNVVSTSGSIFTATPTQATAVSSLAWTSGAALSAAATSVFSVFTAAPQFISVLQKAHISNPGQAGSDWGLKTFSASTGGSAFQVLSAWDATLTGLAISNANTDEATFVTATSVVTGSLMTGSTTATVLQSAGLTGVPLARAFTPVSIPVVTNVATLTGTSTMATTGLPSFNYNGSFAMTTATSVLSYLWGQFSAGIMRTGSNPLSIDLKDPVIVERGSLALVQPWMALIGS